MTKALSKFARRVCCRKLTAASCSKSKRLCTDPLVSTSSPSSSGRSVSRRKFTIDWRRLVIVQDGEIALVQIAHELATMVGGNEQHIDLVDPLLDGKDGVRRIGSRWKRRPQAGPCWRRPHTDDCARAGNPAMASTTATTHQPPTPLRVVHSQPIPKFSRQTQPNSFVSQLDARIGPKAARCLLLQSDSRGLARQSQVTKGARAWSLTGCGVWYVWRGRPARGL